MPREIRRIRAAWIYRSPIRESVHRFKYRGEFERGRDLGRRIAHIARELIGDVGNIDVVVPVPLHPRRLRERGFNQALVLAKQIAPSLDCDVLPLVERVRYTRSQTGLEESERVTNMTGAFRVSDEFGTTIGGASVLIVDDVITTGATVGAVAAALVERGVSEVRAIAVAR